MRKDLAVTAGAFAVVFSALWLWRRILRRKPPGLTLLQFFWAVAQCAAGGHWHGQLGCVRCGFCGRRQ